MQNGKVRSDIWTDEQDIILAEVMLRHIRNGSKLGLAYEEAANLTGRSSAGTNFRWQSVVKKKYASAIEIAKQQFIASKSGNAAPSIAKVVDNVVEIGTTNVVQQVVTQEVENAKNFVLDLIGVTPETQTTNEEGTKSPLARISDMLLELDAKASSVEKLANDQHAIIINQHQQIVELLEDLAIANNKVAELEIQVQNQQQNQLVSNEDLLALSKILERAKNLSSLV